MGEWINVSASSAAWHGTRLTFTWTELLTFSLNEQILYTTVSQPVSSHVFMYSILASCLSELVGCTISQWYG
jgi:hypothetical protein